MQSSYKKILVVDDFSVARNMIKNFLKEFDFEFLEAENGKAGVETFLKHSDIGFIVSDINMPEMGGLEMLEAIRTGGACVGSIVVSSVRATPEQLNRATAAGVVAWVTKPFKKEQLIEIVKKHLKIWLNGHA